MTTGASLPPRRRLLRWIAPAAAVALLLLVFAAWLRPAMVMQVAQQVWSCF